MEDNNKKIDELYSNLSNVDANQSDFNSRKNKKRALLTVSGLLITFASIVTLFTYMNNNKQQEVVEQTKVVQEVKKEESTPVVEEEKFVIDVPIWAKNNYYALEEHEKLEIETYMDNTDFYYITDVFPSEANGFTSDLDKQFDENGFPNIMFTFVTREELKYYTNLYLNMIVNPVFGGWLDYQYPNELTKNDYLEDYLFFSIDKDLPFFIDSDNNNYNLDWNTKDGEKPVRWIGKINNIKNIETNENGDEFNVFAEYSMYQNVENGTKKDFDIKLTLTYDKNSANKLVISDYSIKEVN